jgi:subtilase family serine protease
VKRHASKLGSAVSAVIAVLAIAAPATSAKTRQVRIKHSAPPAASTGPTVGSVPGSTSIPFEIDLQLPDQAAAQAFAQSVSTPGSASDGHYLSASQWEQRFSPAQRTVDRVVAFLKQHGFTGISASPDRMAVDATGTATQIEQTFSTSLSYHRFRGHKLRFANRNLSVPSTIAGSVAGVSGVSETLAQPQAAGSPQTGNPTAPAPPSGGSPFPPPAGFRVAPPCGSYYGQAIDASQPPFGNGYPSDPPWAVCGYAPPQLRSAYNLTSRIDGSGVTVAIVDAYASPTIFSDAHHYAALNDPSNPLRASQFSQITAKTFNHADQCDPSGWFGEETLDVEAVHGMAPGANIVFSGAKNCGTPALNRALRKVVDKQLASVITNSYGDDGGDVLDSAGDRASTDNILLMAAGTGITVMFSSGDDGDEFTTVGQVAADYPASSPWATAVGGTTLQIGSHGQRVGEDGWSTARSFLCNAAYVTAGGCDSSQLGTWMPIDLALDGGSGGGTSVDYIQPFYQRGVVPSSLSKANGSTPMRVEPDVSMEADPATGFLEGETQTFPDGVYYDQYRIGGTSVASPLFAGLVARADQVAGRSLGFVNPNLYSLYRRPGAFYDILPAGKQDQSRADFVNSVDASQGFLYTTRIIDYEGQEEFCDENNNCSDRNVALATAPGYDNMTGLGAPNSGLVGDLASH